MRAPCLARSIRRARLGERLAALAVAATLVASASPVSAHVAPDAAEVERLYVEGQDKYAAKDFKGAADAWTRLLDMLPESGANQATRENVLINILQAHLDAYRRMRNDDGSKQIVHLREGKKTLDQYYAAFKNVHGDRVAVSAAVQEKGDELEQELTKAEEELAAQVGATQTEPPREGGGEAIQPVPGGDDKPKVVVLEAQNNGMGLIVGGSVVAALGVAAVVMIPIGVARGKTAEQDYTDAQEEMNTTKMERADFEGKQANAILVSGAILAPLLLAGGATMIAFGVINRNRAKEERLKGAQGITGIAPAFGRRFAGFAISGRF